MKRLALLFVLCQSAWGATLNWPGVAGCSTTLQACVDSATAGDTIEILTEGTIGESITIGNKSLTLTKRGAAALFAPLQTINLVATANNVNITLSNLQLRNTVSVQVGSANAAHTQSITLNNLRVSSDGLAAVLVNQVAASSSSYSVAITRSYLSHNIASGSAVFIEREPTAAGRASFNVSNNQMMVRGSGIFAKVSAHDGVLNFNANRIGRLQQLPVGGTISGGVYVVGEGGGPTPTVVRANRNVIYNVDSGVTVQANTASLNTNVVNNTISNTNLYGLYVSAGSGNALSGRLANNILHQSRGCALQFFGSGAVSVTHDYNLYSQSSSSYCGTTAGANDVNATARFRSQFDFRSASSAAPQVDAGNNNDQPQIPIVLVFVPTPDIDGRAGRVGTVDIGAHERSFDESFDHVSSPSTVSGNLTRINTSPVGLISSDNLMVSQFGRTIDGFTPLPPGAANHSGVWYSGANSVWSIFNQNTAQLMPNNRRFFVLLNVNSQSTYVHTASAANTAFNVTLLSNSQLDNKPDALPIVTQRWDPEQTGSGVYNNSSIGVWYDTSVNRWRIFNQLQSPGPAPAIPLGAAFNVLIPNPLFAAGTHAFRTDPLGVAVQTLNLSHPLLDNIECAHPYVTAVYNPNDVYVPSNLVLSYNPASEGRGNWAIERGDGQPIPAGAAFHVYIDPARSRQCIGDPLLIDGFE